MKKSSNKSFKRCSQILLSLVLISFGISSCNKDEDNSGNDPVITNDNVYFLDQESQSTLDSVNTDVLYFSSLGRQIEALQTNDILVSSVTENAPNGFIRKVKNVRLENSNVIIETEIASMTEAFCSFDFNWQQSNNTLGLRSFPVQRSKIDAVLYDNDKDPNTTNDQIKAGFYYDYLVTPLFHYTIFDFDIEERAKRTYYIEYDGYNWTSKEEVDIEPYDNPFNINVGLDAKSGISLNLELQLFDMDNFRSSIGPATFVSAKSEYDLVNVEYEYEIKGCAEATAKVVMKPFSHSLVDYERSFIEHCFYEKSGFFNGHCNDGELNFDEEEVDCGGANCPPCPCEHPDLLGLESLYNNTNGGEWINNEGWLSNCDPCSWFGVNCVNDRVKTITLKNNNLTGELTPLLGQLSELTQLDFSNNNLQGHFSSSILVANKLVSIQLQNNQLSGEIPHNINDLQSLILLNFENNNISGKLPEALNEIQTLERLNLKNNKLTGCIENILSVLCSKDVDLSENVGLPFNGDFERICATEIGYCSGCLDLEAHNYNPFATSGNDSDCETCHDGIQNGDEESVDCGGEKCEECDLCYDDILVDNRDGNEYRIQNIGQFWWMAENLRYESSESICLYDSDQNCLVRIYNVLESIGACEIDVDGIGNFVQGICPSGWHIPTKEEMVNLLSEVSTVEKFGFAIWTEPNFEYEAWGTKSKIELLQCLEPKSATAVYRLSNQSLTGPILLDNSIVFYTSTLSSEHPDHNPAALKRYAVELFPYSESTNFISTIYPNSDWATGACGVNGANLPDITSYQYYPCRCIKNY